MASLVINLWLAGKITVSTGTLGGRWGYQFRWFSQILVFVWSAFGCARHLHETLNRLRACCDCSIRDVVWGFSLACMVATTPLVLSCLLTLVWLCSCRACTGVGKNDSLASVRLSCHLLLCVHGPRGCCPCWALFVIVAARDDLVVSPSLLELRDRLRWSFHSACSLPTVVVPYRRGPHG